MSEPIENEYFDWLCAKVLDSNFEIHTLMLLLYKTEFIWVVHADKHRAEDGLELRQEFLIETGLESEELWEQEPCSIFEFLIAFAGRANFQIELSVKEWFWIFMQNLGLSDFRNQAEINFPEVENVLHKFIWRTYNRRGIGGMFPMPRTDEDQREVEIWYQFCDWVDYQGLI